MPVLRKWHGHFLSGGNVENIYQLMGKTAKGKLVRYGSPTGVGKITSVRDAAMGNVRVTLEDGSTALMLYPDLEIVK